MMSPSRKKSRVVGGILSGNGSTSIRGVRMNIREMGIRKIQSEKEEQEKQPPYRRYLERGQTQRLGVRRRVRWLTLTDFDPWHECVVYRHQVKKRMCKMVCHCLLRTKRHCRQGTQDSARWSIMALSQSQHSFIPLKPSYKVHFVSVGKDSWTFPIDATHFQISNRSCLFCEWAAIKKEKLCTVEGKMRHIVTYLWQPWLPSVCVLLLLLLLTRSSFPASSAFSEINRGRKALYPWKKSRLSERNGAIKINNLIYRFPIEAESNLQHKLLCVTT